MKLGKSGIPGLDRILGGGFLEGSIVTIGGPTGSGRSTMALQFILDSDEPGLYISIEESKKDLFFHMSNYKWNLPEAEQQGKLVILDYPIYEVDQIVEQQGAIQEIIQTTGVKRVVIDSIMPIALFFPNQDERRKGFLKLIDNIRRWGVTTVIVAEDPEAKEVGKLPYTNFGIENFTDGWINIYYQYDEEKGERSRAVEVLKMKGMEHSKRHYPAKMDRNGFVILSGEEKPRGPAEREERIEERIQAAKEILKKPAVRKKTLGIRKKK